MSVGHIARLLEEAGVPTVIIATQAFRPRLEALKPSRLVLTPFPMGRPLGAAHDAQTQRQTLAAALTLLSTATEGETILELDLPFRPSFNG